MLHLDRKHLPAPYLKIFINQIILQINCRQNPNASELFPVASDESFVGFCLH